MTVTLSCINRTESREMRFFTVDVLKNRMTADDELEMEERIHDASTGHEKRPYMTQL